MKLDEGQKDLLLMMGCLFGGASLLTVAIGVTAWLTSLGGCA